jgi:hypothetical protein
VAIGDVYKRLLEEPFKKVGINVLWLPGSCNLDPRVRWHADMIMHHLGDNKLIVSADTYEYAVNVINSSEYTGLYGHNWGIYCSDEELKDSFPNDILFNSLRIGRYLFCSIEHTDVRILEYCYENGIECVDVKQGYAKCSVCVIDCNSAITADPSIANAMENKGLDVLRISAGHIELTGYNTGFIGGASGKIAKDRIAFTGLLDEHPECSKIIEFLESKSVQPVFLTNRECFDVGSIIPLIENR